MNGKTRIFAATVFASVLVAGVLLAGAPPFAVNIAYAACDPGVKIDGSSASDAKKKIEAQGYQKVANLKKGCDNFWHGTAVKDGTSYNISLSPDGTVAQEGN